MRPQRAFPPDTAEQIERFLAYSHYELERRRMKCVYLRAKYGYSAGKIAEMVGLKLQTVRNIHAAFLKRGGNSLSFLVKGGRKNFYLEPEVEAALLDCFAEAGKSDGVKVGQIQTTYQEKVGKKVVLSTIYRMLHRHGWRKLDDCPGGWCPPGKGIQK